MTSLSARRAVSESNSARRSSNNWNVGADSALREAFASVSRRDRASATVLVVPGLYSTVKSKPRSLLTY
jgi:hypothetical protein